MKRIIPFLLILYFSFLVFVAFAEEPGVSDTLLSIYPAYLQTPLDMPVVLYTETVPEGQKLIWSSLDPSVAVVDAEGCVSPVNPGETVITCALAGQPGVTATCGVLVVAEGKIRLWEYPPAQIDLRAIIAALEAEDAANLPEAPEVPWPDAWPDILPKIEGKVTCIYGDSPQSETGLIVILSDLGIDTAQAYVNTLISMGFKANDFSNESNYFVMLKGDGHNIRVTYDLNSLECTVLVSK